MFNTRFSGLDGTNSMSGEHNGLQIQRVCCNVPPFSIHVNCKCHLALSFTDQFPWLESIDRLLLGLWKDLSFWKKLSHFEIYSRSLRFKSTEFCNCCSY